jgi:hypothetical protein
MSLQNSIGQNSISVCNNIIINDKITSCRGCDHNLSVSNPASQYQRQKIIQNTVRVQSSLYTMNLGALSAYTKPLYRSQMIQQSGSVFIVPPYINWNQMSDRPQPSIQRVVNGSNRTIVPGAMSPGGVGVDIKHNSYDRYLRRIKGKTPLRRGMIPPNYGDPIVFNRAYPVYGGKIVKTNIIEKCGCSAPEIIYKSQTNAVQDSILNIVYTFNINDNVLAHKSSTDYKLYKAIIKYIQDDYVIIEFADGLVITTTVRNISIDYNHNCILSIDEFTNE